jgi:uncharacterized protein (TIGR03382 family)
MPYRVAMRVAWALAVAAAPAVAIAEPFRDVIVQPPRHATSRAGFTGVSHLIYLNNCLPYGCMVDPGYDDSRTNHSSIPTQQSQIAAWSWGPDLWSQLVQCVTDTYAPFDIQITTVDPGDAPHFELMVGGNSTDIGIEGAGGVAPFIPCDGALQDNVISFVFSAETNDLNFLCGAAAQETSHVFGLDHELDAKDPMTYLDLGSRKVFQDELADCGEYNPRDCWCSGSQQNTVQYLNDTFGPAVLLPASLAIDTPADGSWQKPGFALHATAMSQLSTRSATLAVDGVVAATADTLDLDAPADLSGGDHAITVTATDSAAREISASITVHVPVSCAAATCDDGFDCLGGLCLPGADVPGGLGASCSDNPECITGTCSSDGHSHLCAGPCDAGDKCPSGFACTPTSAGDGVCWPSTGGGGCSATNSGPAFALFGLAMLVLRRRR